MRAALELKHFRFGTRRAEDCAPYRVPGVMRIAALFDVPGQRPALRFLEYITRLAFMESKAHFP